MPSRSPTLDSSDVNFIYKRRKRRSRLGEISTPLVIYVLSRTIKGDPEIVGFPCITLIGQMKAFPSELKNGEDLGPGIRIIDHRRIGN